MEQQDFRVSVVITSYNQKDYLAEAIESVINQTLSPHEVFIADDCSTDESVELIREYIARYPGWIKGVFQKENVGIPKNRNAALRHVTGNYVAILDGDDRFLPYNIERELRALQEHPEARCVYTNVRFIDAEGRPTGVRDQEDQPSGDVLAYVARGQFGLLRSMLIYYPVLREIGFLDERFPKYDGFDLTVQLAKRCRFIYVPEPLVEYRIHSASDSRILTARDHLHDLEGIYEKMLPLLVDLPDAQRRSIAKIWSQRLLRLRLRDARERGASVEVVFLSLLGIATGHGGLRDLRQAVMPLVPNVIRRTVKQLWGLSRFPN